MTEEPDAVPPDQIHAVTPTGNALFRILPPCTGVVGTTPIGCTERIGNAGRNILRADGINNMDFGIVKNTNIGETQRLQIRADFFDVTNTRDFGTPQSVITNSGFLNQWGTDGGNRRIIVGLRYIF